MTSSRVFIAGVTPPAFARAAARKAANRNRAGKLSGPQMSAVQRRSELRNLARLRLRSGGPLGPESGWIECIANALRVRNGTVSAEDIAAEVHRLRLPSFNADLVESAVTFIAKAAWGRYELYPPNLAGDKLQLTAAERIEAGIVRIAAIDESIDERRRRRDREYRSRKRAAEAALAPRKVTKRDMAQSLGISRPTLDAWIAKGIVDAETGELSFTFPVARSLLLRNDKTTKSVKSPGEPE
jgi:predicted DNA-binding transcriptional regulator AlpA